MNTSSNTQTMNNSKEIDDFLDTILSLQGKNIFNQSILINWLVRIIYFLDEQNDQIKRFTEVTKSLSKNADTVSSVISKYSKREDLITLETSKQIKELTGTVIQNINEFAKYTKSDRNDEFGEKFEECVRILTILKIHFIIILLINFTEIINYLKIKYCKYWNLWIKRQTKMFKAYTQKFERWRIRWK